MDLRLELVGECDCLQIAAETMSVTDSRHNIIGSYQLSDQIVMQLARIAYTCSRWCASMQGTIAKQTGFGIGVRHVSAKAHICTYEIHHVLILYDVPDQANRTWINTRLQTFDSRPWTQYCLFRSAIAFTGKELTFALLENHKWPCLDPMLHWLNAINRELQYVQYAYACDMLTY